MYVLLLQECTGIYSRAGARVSKTVESYCLMQSKQTCVCAQLDLTEMEQQTGEVERGDTYSTYVYVQRGQGFVQ